MITVAQALEDLFALAPQLDCETITLRGAHGRVLARPISALFDQPPFAASSMDGYALGPAPRSDGRYRVVGTSSAGHGFPRALNMGEAVRIFTGAPVPQGALRVLIQENALCHDGLLTVCADDDANVDYIRPKGNDFHAGMEFDPKRPLAASDLALIAAMGHGEISVARKPQVALIATGDELVMPGNKPGPDQIIASNIYGLAAQIERNGGRARIVPIARDDQESLMQAFALAQNTDLVVTIGGASVGDHDLVRSAAAQLGLVQKFYKIAMRPGKPLMAGRLGRQVVLGLPGNPVSALVCGTLFLCPMLRKMQGLSASPAPRRTVTLAAPVAQNGAREHYMRAIVTRNQVHPLSRQDSALLHVLSQANALLVRPPHDRARESGDRVEIIDLID